MVIHLTAELEAVLSDQARQRGVSAEDIALDVLRDRFLGNVAPIEARDDWERRLFECCPRLRRVRTGFGLKQRRIVRIMAILVDTSVLGRLANRADISHRIAESAVAETSPPRRSAPRNRAEFD